MAMTASSMNNHFMMSSGHHFSCADNNSHVLSDVVKVTSAFCALIIGIISSLIIRIKEKSFYIQVPDYDSA